MPELEPSILCKTDVGLVQGASRGNIRYLWHVVLVGMRTDLTVLIEKHRFVPIPW